MRYFFFIACMLMSSLSFSDDLTEPYGPPEEQNLPEWQRQVNQIDADIKRKNNQKNLYLAKAARAQDQGDRLQFRPDNLGDARRYWQVADTYREKAKLMDLEILLLQKKRAQILQENNIKNY